MIVKMALGVTSEMDNVCALLAGLEFSVMIVSEDKIDEAPTLAVTALYWHKSLTQVTMFIEGNHISVPGMKKLVNATKSTFFQRHHFGNLDLREHMKSLWQHSKNSRPIIACERSRTSRRRLSPSPESYLCLPKRQKALR